ncbi:Chromosomal replication initiator protein DnaA [subsurface metagenome]
MGNIIISFNKRNSHFIDKIIDIVARQTNITPKQLKSKTNKREVVQPRQLAMYMADEYTTASLKTIGSMIGGKNHVTVIHSLKTVNNLKKTDQEYKGLYYILKEKIENAAINFDASEYDFVCISCGGINVNTKAWVTPNTKEFIEFTDYFPYDNWCKDCQINVQLIKKMEYDKLKEGK